MPSTGHANDTVASFVVDDIVATLATEKAAWFKDTEGNILAVSQFL